MQKYTQYFYLFLFISIFVLYWVSNCHILSGSGTSILEFGYSLDLQKKTAPGRWFCMQFPYPSVSHRWVTRRSEAEISPVSPLHSLNLKVWRSSTQRDVSETDWAQRFDKGFKKKGVSWVNLSLLIYYWWIEVASDGFLAWCDVMPRAFCTLGGQNDTSETRTGSRSRVLSSTRSGFLLGHPFTGKLSMRSQKAGYSHIVFLLPCFIFPWVYI